jgi:hypothetical protein
MQQKYACRILRVSTENVVDADPATPLRTVHPTWLLAFQRFQAAEKKANIVIDMHLHTGQESLIQTDLDGVISATPGDSVTAGSEY